MTANLPRVSYIKAIDLWLIFSIIFVISVLVEYAIAITLLRRKRRENWRNDVEHIVKEELARWCAACQQTQLANLQLNTGGLGHEFSQQFAFFNDLDTFLTRTVIEESQKKSRKNKIPEATESEIDAYSRFLFPTCYIMYNVFYWLYYLVIVKQGEETDT
nr:unnamed protein product [Spirometra erinaceieuropaei]